MSAEAQFGAGNGAGQDKRQANMQSGRKVFGAQTKCSFRTYIVDGSSANSPSPGINVGRQQKVNSWERPPLSSPRSRILLHGHLRNHDLQPHQSTVVVICSRGKRLPLSSSGGEWDCLELGSFVELLFTVPMARFTCLTWFPEPGGLVHLETLGSACARARRQPRLARTYPSLCMRLRVW